MLFTKKAKPVSEDEISYKNAVSDLRHARHVFDEVTEPSLVEQAIHRMMLAEMIVDYYYAKLRISG